MRDCLREAAEHSNVFSSQTDFYAMGRSFSSGTEIKAYFAVLLRHANDRGGTFKIYHANSLFYLFSLREKAPQYLTGEQAEEIATKIIARLKELISENNYNKAMTTCLRALAGLTRYRLVDRRFLAPTTDAGEMAQKTVGKIVERSQNMPHRRLVLKVASDVLSVLEARGVPEAILEWDSDDDDDN